MEHATMSKKVRRMGDRYEKHAPKMRLRFVGGDGAPETLHGEPLRVGDVRLLSARYLLYRWWKLADEEGYRSIEFL